MIIILCGPAGSGKSSIAQRLIEELNDARLLSSDRFKRIAYERIMREVEKSRGKQEHLVIDATFYRKKWRDRLKGVAADEKVATIFVDCPLETCLRRNLERETPIPEKAIQIIWNLFERPENPDIYINTEKISIEQAVEKIINELKKL